MAGKFAVVALFLFALLQMAFATGAAASGGATAAPRQAAPPSGGAGRFAEAGPVDGPVLPGAFQGITDSDNAVTASSPPAHGGASTIEFSTAVVAAGVAAAFSLLYL